MASLCPPTAFLTLDTTCGGGCAYCFYELEPTRRVPSQLDLDGWCGVLDALAQRGLQVAILTGGEPTATPGLPELVAHASGLGLGTVLLTGRALDPTLAVELRRTGLSTCVLSAHAMTALRAGLASLDALEATPCSVTWVITAANAAQLPEAIAACRRRGHPVLLQPAWIPTDHPAAAALDPRRLATTARTTLVERFATWASNAGLEDYGRLVTAWLESRFLAPTHCSLGREALVLDADGAVMPCHQRRDLAVGKVGERSWDALLAELATASKAVARAPCYGGHCLPLHLSFRGPGRPKF